MNDLPEMQDLYTFYDPALRYALRYGSTVKTLFVFGSNLAGKHGKGAAKDAYHIHGAIYGNPEGLQNMSYALPTKSANLRILSLDVIKGYVDTFVEFTKNNKQFTFYVTAVGTGLAEYKDEDIAPMFRGAINCYFPEQWRKYICAV